MRRMVCVVLVFVSMIGCLCTNALAFEDRIADTSGMVDTEAVIMRASGSFNMS